MAGYLKVWHQLNCHSIMEFRKMSCHSAQNSITSTSAKNKAQKYINTTTIEQPISTILSPTHSNNRYWSFSWANIYRWTIVSSLSQHLRNYTPIHWGVCVYAFVCEFCKPLCCIASKRPLLTRWHQYSEPCFFFSSVSGPEKWIKKAIIL